MLLKVKIPFTQRYIEIRSGLAQPESWLIDALVGSKAVSGVNVTPAKALQSAAVFACVRVIAETVASLPLPVYRRLQGRGKERAADFYLYPILHDQPNPEMTSFELRETLMGHLCLWGNAYCEIVRDGAGRVRELWPLRPDKMSVKRENGQLVYDYQLPDGQVIRLRQSQVFHIRALSGDGIIGYSPISTVREAIGLALATEEFGARFFGNGTHPGLVVSHPGKLSDQAHKNLKQDLTEKYSGLGKAHRILLLEEGMSVEKIGIPPEDAQFLETRKFQLNEICRIFRVPPHLVGDLERATFSNIEHQSIEFVIHTIRPWLVRWEQAIRRDLFLPSEKSTYFAEFLVDGLLRGDIKSRYDAYAVGRQNGWLSADDIRELENMNPLPDGQGKVYLVPLNMVPADSVSAPPQQPTQEQASARAIPLDYEERGMRSAAGRQKLAKSFRRLFSDIETRIVKREEAEVMRAAEKFLTRRDAQQFDFWLQDFYQGHQEYMKRTWAPAYMTYADAIQTAVVEEIGSMPGMTPELEEFVRAYLASHVALHAGSSLGQLRQVLREAVQVGQDELEAIQQRLEEWKERRPGKIAMAETVQLAGAVAFMTYKLNGIRRVRWVTFNPACPYCRDLNGRIVGLESPFLEPGIEFKPDGADRPLTTNVKIHHPPAHEGCDCQIIASS